MLNAPPVGVEPESSASLIVTTSEVPSTAAEEKVGAIVSWTVIDGDEVSAVSVPPEVDFCLPDQVCAPVVDGAVALEYVTSTVAPPASESEPTVIVWPETETEPADEVV